MHKSEEKIYIFLEAPVAINIGEVPTPISTGFRASELNRGMEPTIRS